MRLIDADKLHDCIMDSDIHNGIMSVKNVYEFIDTEPTVDAVPVVRCKDCKNYLSYFGHKCCFVFCDGREDPYSTRPDDFCSYGVKMDEGETQ